MIASEDDFQKSLAEGMKKAGWRVEREVSPDNSADRVDIIGIREDIGKIGIEAKYVTNSGPKETGEALNQLLSQYAGKSYGDTSIDAWGIALHGDGLFTSDYGDYGPHSKEYQFACRRISIQLGIGYVINHRGMVILDFGISSPELRLPLFYTEGRQIDDKSYVQCDMDRIRDISSNRLPV